MTGYVPAVAKSAVVNVAVKCVASIYVVALGDPLNRTTESDMKSIPVISTTVSVVPETIVDGVRVVSSGVVVMENFWMR